VLAQGLEVGGDQDVIEPAGQLAGLSRFADQGLGQAVVERGADLQIRIAQAVFPACAELARAGEGQIAGLPEQRLGCHPVHIEGRQQGLVGAQVRQLGGVEAALGQHVHQKGRRAGLEPPGTEFARVQQ